MDEAKEDQFLNKAAESLKNSKCSSHLSFTSAATAITVHSLLSFFTITFASYVESQDDFLRSLLAG